MIRRFVQWAGRGDRPAGSSGGSTLFFEPMEPKILLSADALSGLVPASPSSDEDSAPLTLQDSVELFEDLKSDELARATSPNDAPSLDELAASLLSPREPSDRLELVFVDANAPDYQQLLQGIGDRPGVEIKVFVLEADADGTAQISSILAEYQGVDAIHLLSHGDDTGFQLGRDWVDASSLDKYSNDFSNWGQSLSRNADILLYGCNLASDPAGERLLNDLARLTSADIAASDDLTGHASLGGDWDLEFTSGDIEASVIADAELQDLWAGTLATETLNPSQDTYVNKDSEDANYGTSVDLFLDKSGGGLGDQRILVQFDLSTIPAGSTITSATLYLTAIDVTGSTTIEAYQVNSAWNGTTVTWDTQPTTEPDASPPSFTATATGVHSWDITSFAQAWVDGTVSNNGVLLGSSETGTEVVKYQSSETGNAPRLEVVYGSSPPTATDNTGEVTEDGPTNTTGNVITDDDGDGVDSDPEDSVDQLVVSEVDGNAGNVASAVTGTYGSVTIGSDGNYTYNLDNSSATVQALAQGETLTDTFSYTVSDQAGDTDTATLTITINGTNDAPVSTANSNLIVVDQTNVSGNMLTDDDGAGVDSDIDGDALSVSAIDNSGADQYGTLTLDNADGSYTYTLDDNNPLVQTILQALGFGQTLTETYSYTVSDGQGGTDTATLTITIRGTNDDPVATANSNAIAEDAVSVSGNMVTDDDGAGVDSDVDGDPLSVSAIDSSGADQYGTLTLDNADGSYTYTLDNSNPTVQALGVGQSLTEVYTYTVSDGLGGTDTATLTITITGTNDAPVITGGPGNVALNETDAALTGSGDFTVSDLDTSDTVTASVNGLVVGGASDRTDPAAPSDAELGAMLTVSPTATVDGTSNSATLGWSFDSASEAFDYLAAGETLELTYTVRAEDSQGATADETVTVTITGTNDAPVITGGPDTVALNETDTALTSSGDFTISDLDTSDTVTASVNGLVVGGTSDRTDPAAPSDAELEAMLTVSPTATVDGTSNSATLGWSFDSASEAFDYLAAGETLELTYTVRAEDSQGATADETVTITITGSNDAPVATANSNLIVKGQASVSGNMLADDDGAGVDSDVDGDALSVSAIDSSGADQYGTLTLDDADGSYTYTLDNTNPLLEALGIGQTLTETYSYTVIDGQGGTDTATLTITIRGTNDDPVATANSNAIAEDAVSVSGNMVTDDDGAGVDSDVDGDALSVSAIDSSGADQYGTLTLDNADGSYTYTIDNSNPTVQALGVGQSLTEVYTYTVSDGLGGTDTATLTITITGTNDAPTISGLPESTSYNFNSDVVPLNDLVITDVDGAEVVTATLTLLNPAVGQLSDNDGAIYNQTTGVWSITGTVGDVNTALANLTFIPKSGNVLNSTIAINVDDGDEDGSGPLLGALKVSVNAPLEVSDDLVRDRNDSSGEDAGDPASASEEETPEELPAESSAETVLDEKGSVEQREANQDGNNEFVSWFDGLDQPPALFEASVINAALSNEQSAAAVSESEKAIQFLREQVTQLNEPFQLLDRDSFIRQLDDMREDLVEEQSEVEKLLGASLSVSAGISVGYVVWLARSGIIMSSVLSSLPAWRFIDPLPVLATLAAPAAEEDRESLESMVMEANQGKSSGVDQNESS